MPIPDQDGASAAMIPGFANHIVTEAVAGAVPIGRNSPQRPAHGLYAEQLSGTVRLPMLPVNLPRI